MKNISEIYGFISDVLACQPEKFNGLKAPPLLQKRFGFLVEKQHHRKLSAKESDELNHFIMIERIVRLAKIKMDVP